jgi:hypothetical protein
MIPRDLFNILHHMYKFARPPLCMVKATKLRYVRRGHLHLHDLLTKFNKILLIPLKVVREYTLRRIETDRMVI